MFAAVPYGSNRSVGKDKGQGKQNAVRPDWSWLGSSGSVGKDKGKGKDNAVLPHRSWLGSSGSVAVGKDKGKGKDNPVLLDPSWLGSSGSVSKDKGKGKENPVLPYKGKMNPVLPIKGQENPVMPYKGKNNPVLPCGSSDKGHPGPAIQPWVKSTAKGSKSQTMTDNADVRATAEEVEASQGEEVVMESDLSAGLTESGQAIDLTPGPRAGHVGDFYGPSRRLPRPR